MNKEYLKKALMLGIPVGLLFALAIILFRTLIGGEGFVTNLKSLYGILSLICFPIAWVFAYYSTEKRRDEERKDRERKDQEN